MIIFFDTETTGLPKDWKAPMTKLDNWPRVLQLAWALFDWHGNLIRSNCDLIAPDGWVVPDGDFWKTHGYSTEKCAAEGISIAIALAKFLSAANECEALGAHNMAYDYNVLGAEMIRAGKRLNPGIKLTRYCTQELGTNYCQLPGFKGQFKWPKLEELHTKLFNCSFDGAHDALNDVMVSAKCFFQLMDLGEVPGLLSAVERIVP